MIFIFKIITRVKKFKIFNNIDSENESEVMKKSPGLSRVGPPRSIEKKTNKDNNNKRRNNSINNKHLVRLTINVDNYFAIVLCNILFWPN